MRSCVRWEMARTGPSGWRSRRTRASKSRSSSTPTTAGSTGRCSNREVEKLAVLYTSRNIVRLIDVGWNSEPPYYVMEYLAHGSLASFLTAGPLPPQEAVRIAKSVLLALVHAHGSGILHCDLKPANVLLDNDFEPRLCDFGQSRLSNEQNPALGTVFYMAPEQADLQAIPDARWDVYALGALLVPHAVRGTPLSHAGARRGDPLGPHAGDEARRLSAADSLESQAAGPAVAAGDRSAAGRNRRAVPASRSGKAVSQRAGRARHARAARPLAGAASADHAGHRRAPRCCCWAMAWLVVQLLDTTGTDASIANDCGGRSRATSSRPGSSRRASTAIWMTANGNCRISPSGSSRKNGSSRSRPRSTSRPSRTRRPTRKPSSRLNTPERPVGRALRRAWGCKRTLAGF